MVVTMDSPLNPLPNDTFIRRLRAERERRNVGQAELSRRMSALLGQQIGAPVLNRIEQGLRAVRLDEAVAAATALDMPIGVLLGPVTPHLSHTERVEQLTEELRSAQAQLEHYRYEVSRLAELLSAVIDEET